MKYKDLKINFRYLIGNIACLSVDSISGEIVHNDINNEEAIIIFNSLVGEKEDCQTVKTLLEENEELKKKLTQYHLDIDKLCKIDNPFDKVKYKNTKYMIEENKKLEKQLQIKAEGFKTVNEELCEYAEENEKLKKELEEANKKLYLCTPEIPQNVHGAYVSYVDLVNDIYKSKKQQQEFIDYLEKEIGFCNRDIRDFNKNYRVYYLLINDLRIAKKRLEEILQKYKEIIGVKDE